MRIIQRLNRLKNLLLRSQFHYYRNAMLHPPFWLSAGGRTTRILANDSLGSSTAYYEVIVEDTYRMFEYSKHHHPSVIADIGANVGMFSKLCSLLFPDAEIYSYEPNPDAFSWLNKNAEATCIKAYPCAVSDRSGVVMLNPEYDSTIGLISPEGKIPVNCLAASEVAEGRSIDLLKMDCEGSEWIILQNDNLLQRTKYFCLEYHLHNQLGTGHNTQELRELLEKADHRILYMSDNIICSEHK